MIYYHMYVANYMNRELSKEYKPIMNPYKFYQYNYTLEKCILKISIYTVCAYIYIYAHTYVFLITIS